MVVKAFLLGLQAIPYVDNFYARDHHRGVEPTASVFGYHETGIRYDWQVVREGRAKKEEQAKSELLRNEQANDKQSKDEPQKNELGEGSESQKADEKTLPT
jgi:hypothetical protein